LKHFPPPTRKKLKKSVVVIQNFTSFCSVRIELHVMVDDDRGLPLKKVATAIYHGLVVSKVRVLEVRVLLI
jgi:hypothetical protein